MEISGWGRSLKESALINSPKTRSDCIDALKHNPLIARGLGRSYGDSAINKNVLETSNLNKIISFNSFSGLLKCESGLSVYELLPTIITSGWFLPVTAGTAYTTIGGAMASDIHGKNHHIEGTIGDHIKSADLLLGSGEIVEISRTENPDLFRATCGGMGLTGLIISATIQLKPISSNLIKQRIVRPSSLQDLCEEFEKNKKSNYSVAWIDTINGGPNLTKSVLTLGEHHTEDFQDFNFKSNISIPVEMPSFLLNYLTIKMFNLIFYRKKSLGKEESLSLFLDYFYPLDKIKQWNKLYGKKGFLQYQFVIPKEDGLKNLQEIFLKIKANKNLPFLNVFKMFGKSNSNYLSFPMEGYTVALDFKINNDVIKLMNDLDDMIITMGGRIYLTKDSLISESSFKKMYKNWEEFQEVRAKYHALGKFSSNQSKRIGLE